MSKNTIRIVSGEETPGFEHFPVGSILKIKEGGDAVYMVILFKEHDEIKLLSLNVGTIVDESFAKRHYFTLVKEINIKSE